MITSEQIVEQLVKVMTTVVQTMREPTRDRTDGIHRDRIASIGLLTRKLEAWRTGAGWPPPRDSAFERARRDPVFHSLVRVLHGLMLQGDAEYTPTEVREAAMVAQTLLEQERTMLHWSVPPPIDSPNPGAPA